VRPRRCHVVAVAIGLLACACIAACGSSTRAHAAQVACLHKAGITVAPNGTTQIHTLQQVDALNACTHSRSLQQLLAVQAKFLEEVKKSDACFRKYHASFNLLAKRNPGLRKALANCPNPFQ
jgi:hypothetical protein